MLEYNVSIKEGGLIGLKSGPDSHESNSLKSDMGTIIGVGSCGIIIIHQSMNIEIDFLKDGYDN